MVLPVPLILSILKPLNRLSFFEKIAGNDKLARKCVHMGLENMGSDSVPNWYRKKERAIGCLLTCAASAKASIH